MATKRQAKTSKKHLPREEEQKPIAAKKRAVEKIFEHVDMTKAHAEIYGTDANTATEAVRTANENGIDQIIFLDSAVDHPSIQIAERDYGYRVAWHDNGQVLLVR